MPHFRRMSRFIILWISLGVVASEFHEGGIPHIQACQPVEKQELVSTCNNKKSDANRNCTVLLTVGLDYTTKLGSEPEGGYHVGSLYENAGLTLECVKQELSEVFGNGLQTSRLAMFSWRNITAEKAEGKIWNRANTVQHTFIVPPGIAVNIIQITGECFIYKVRTDRFVVVATNATGKSRSVEQLQIPGLAAEHGKPCPSDVLGSGAGEALNLLEIVPNSDTVYQSPGAVEESRLPFMHRDESRSYQDAPDNSSIILEGSSDLELEANINLYANYSWGEWKFCPVGTYISGYYHSAATAEDVPQGGGPLVADALGIVDIAVRCSDLTGGVSSVVVQITPGVRLELGLEHSFPDEKLVSCPEDAVAVGFQLSSKPFQRFGDDISVENIRLMCSCGTEVAPDTSKMDKVWQLGGKWADHQICHAKQALCGLSVKALPIQWPSPSLQGYDNVGITNVKFQCCDVPSLASTCIPEEKLELVADCDNSLSDKPKICDVELFFGMKYDSSRESERLSSFYESIGHTLDCVGDELSRKFGKHLQMSHIGQFSWVMMTAEKSEGAKVWKSGSSKGVSIRVEAFTRVELFQVVGACGFYRVHTPKFTSITQNTKLGAISEDALSIEATSQPNTTAGPFCWERRKDVIGRDWIATLTTPPHGCVHRKRVSSSLAHFPFSANDGSNRTGIILQLPNHPLAFDSWGELGLCPDGSYIRGWSDMQVDNVGDKLGLVLISTLCLRPSAAKSRRYEMLHVQPGFQKPAESWRESGYLNTLNCIGAGIGVEGRAQLETKPGADRFGFWDTKLICSCGLGSGYSAPAKSGLYDNVKAEICKTRQAICGLQVSYGANSVTDGKVDGSGITNLKTICCDVPSPLTECELEEKFIKAVTCDNSKSAYQRTCHLNLTIGVGYQYKKYEAKSFFYDTNGYSPACLASDVRKKAVQEGVKCGQQGCAFKWRQGKAQLWHEKFTVPHTLVVEPFTKINLHQVIAECGPLVVMTNHFYRIVTNVQTGVTASKALYVLQLPALSTNVAKCEFN